MGEHTLSLLVSIHLEGGGFSLPLFSRWSSFCREALEAMAGEGGNRVHSICSLCPSAAEPGSSPREGCLSGTQNVLGVLNTLEGPLEQ